MSTDLDSRLKVDPATTAPRRATGDRASNRSQVGHSNLAWLLIALFSLAGFAVLTLAVASKVVFTFDQPLLDLARSWDGWPFIWTAVSQSANIPLIVIGLGLVLWLIRKKRRREAALVILVLVAVTAGSEGIKQLVGRPRPSGTGDGIPGVVYSYPSGHVLEALTILGIVALRVWRSSHAFRLRLAVALLVAIEVVLVGVARLALNEHFPTDLLGGLLGGFGALGLYAWWTRPGAWADHPPADVHRAPAGPAGT